MLLLFLESEFVTSKLGYILSGPVKLFLKNTIEPVESYFLYYLKENIRHYGAYSNSSHEAPIQV